MGKSQLEEAARKVIERWDSPYWKDLPHTGESINALREALSLHEQETQAALVERDKLAACARELLNYIERLERDDRAPHPGHRRPITNYIREFDVVQRAKNGD